MSIQNSGIYSFTDINVGLDNNGGNLSQVEICLYADTVPDNFLGNPIKQFYIISNYPTDAILMADLSFQINQSDFNKDEINSRQKIEVFHWTGAKWEMCPSVTSRVEQNKTIVTCNNITNFSSPWVLAYGIIRPNINAGIAGLGGLFIMWIIAFFLSHMKKKPHE